jgi:hypothetical protein
MLRLSVWACGLWVVGCVRWWSLIQHLCWLGLALSRASPLPQGLWSVGGIGWPWCVSGFAVHLSIEGGWAGAIASRASLYV